MKKLIFIAALLLVAGASAKAQELVLVSDKHAVAVYNPQSQQLNIIELTRDDLVKFKSDLPIDEIGICDFKCSAMSRNEMLKAELIIFKDGEQIKEIKNRYRFW